MATFPVPVVYPLENRATTFTKDSFMANAYAEVADEKTVRAIKRPGVTLSASYDVAAPQGVVTYMGVVRVVINNKFFKSAVSSSAMDMNSEQVDFA